MEIEITRLKKLRKGRNSVEIGRIDIMIELLRGAKYKDIEKRIGCNKDRISLVKREYKKDKDNFFKTKYKGAKETITKDITDSIKEYIKEKSNNNQGTDIYEILKFLKLENNIKNYNKVWYITRRKLGLNYQKPYVKDKKSPDNAEEILKKNITESLNGNKFEDFCNSRLEKTKNEDKKFLVEEFINNKEQALKAGNYEIYLQDESCFEIDKTTNRVLMLRGEKLRLKLEDKLHEGFKICGFLSLKGESILQIMNGGKGDDFRDMLIDFDKTINKNMLKILIVDNNSIHFTINVLIECLKRNIMIIPLPKYSPNLNPIEQLWRILKRNIRAKYSKIGEMMEGIFDFAKSNIFTGLVEKYRIKYFH